MKKKHTSRKYISTGKNVLGQTGKCLLSGQNEIRCCSYREGQTYFVMI